MGYIFLHFLVLRRAEPRVRSSCATRGQRDWHHIRAAKPRPEASSRTALAAADLPAECRQLGHRSVKSFFTQIGALHVPRLVVARRIRRLAHCQSTRVPPLFTTDLKDCSLQFNSVVFVHRGSVCCVSSQTETPIGPPRLTQRTDGCLLVS